MKHKHVAALLLGAWILALLSGASMAEEWVSLSAEDQGQAYLKRGSVARHGDELDATVLVNYTRVQTIGDDAFPHRTRVLRFGLNCSTGLVRLSGWTFVSGQWGSGEVVWTGPAVPHVAETPLAGSIESQLVGTLCEAGKVSQLGR